MSTSGEARGIGHLRCSDGDRDLIAEVLAQAFTEGRITFEEHDERLTRVYAARTFGELDVLTEDLVAPSSAPPRGIQSTPAPIKQPSTTTPATSRTVLRDCTAFMASQRPGTHLHIPKNTNLVVILGDARIDLVDATFEATTVSINLNVFMGEVRIRVPDGVRIVSSLNKILGEYTTRNMPQGHPSVTVELGGSVVLGEVSILGPGGRPGKYERFAR